MWEAKTQHSVEHADPGIDRDDRQGRHQVKHTRVPGSTSCQSSPPETTTSVRTGAGRTGWPNASTVTLRCQLSPKVPVDRVAGPEVSPESRTGCPADTASSQSDALARARSPTACTEVTAAIHSAQAASAATVASSVTSRPARQVAPSAPDHGRIP